MAVIGAGQMGNGITQVAACAGIDVVMIDIKDEFLNRGISTIEKSLAKLVSKDRMTQSESDSARARISTSTDRADCSDVDLVVEAVPEILELKLSLFAELDEILKTLDSNRDKFDRYEKFRSRIELAYLAEAVSSRNGDKAAIKLHNMLVNQSFADNPQVISDFLELFRKNFSIK